MPRLILLKSASCSDDLIIGLVAAIAVAMIFCGVLLALDMIFLGACCLLCIMFFGACKKDRVDSLVVRHTAKNRARKLAVSLNLIVQIRHTYANWL